MFSIKKYGELLEKIINLTNVMNKTNKSPRDFGVGFALFPAEIHTLEAIGSHEKLNTNALAKALGITNGAVTQMTDKLVKKGLVEKFKTESNRKEVYYRLTDLGHTAEQAHDRFHNQAYQNIAAYLDRLKPDQLDALAGFLDLYIENLPTE